MTTGVLDTAGFLDRARLQELATRHRERFRTASPFAHVVIDDFADEEQLDQIVAEFPPLGEGGTAGLEVNKSTTSDETLFPPHTRAFVTQLNGSTMIEFLETLTGISGLVPDPHLVGGGLHQTADGGFLKIHADFNRHPRLNLDRRLNLILYLNRDWKPEYGGELELWDESLTVCADKIAPVFNRCVVFETTDRSFHGHPEPLRLPPGVTRKSIALYYYTNGRPRSELSAAHTTLFRARPGEELDRPRGYVATVVAQRILPPIVADGIRRLMQKRARRGA